MFIGGFVPFSAIVLQLHQVYGSMWGYKIYTFPSILVATLITAVVIIALVNIGLTYIQLSVEDHEWWWRYVVLLTNGFFPLPCPPPFVCVPVAIFDHLKWNHFGDQMMTEFRYDNIFKICGEVSLNKTLIAIYLLKKSKIYLQYEAL